MVLTSRKIPSFLVVATLTLLTAGCSSLAHFSDPSTATSPLPEITGNVHGGQQPVSGATIQLYAANATTNKGASQALLAHPPSSGSNGTFTITDTNYCPAPGSLVYLVATGGNPGLTPPVNGSINNTGLALMALLGTCSTLNSSTTISVNELTTVAAVEALAPFMADSTHVGADASNPNGLAGAFAGAAAIVNFTTGTFVTPTTGVTQPTALSNTLANILAACVNTNGSTANGTACGTLFTNAVNGTTTDTILAMLHIAQLPAQNVPNLYGIVNTSGPFQTSLTTAPADFTATTVFALPFSSQTFATTIAIDTSQHVWVASQSGTGASETTGPLAVFDNNGNLLFTVQPGAGGLYEPVQLAADSLGYMWALNNNGTLSKFGSTGNALSPPGGFSILGSQSGTVQLVQNASTADYFAIDPSGNLWGPGTGTGSNNCYTEVNNAGSVITPTSSFCSSGGNVVFTATDGSGDAWFLGTSAISKVNSAGSLVASGVNSNGCFTIVNNSANSTLNLAYDRVNNQLWGVADIGIGVLKSDGSQLFCDANGANLPVIPLYDNVTGSGSTANGSIGALLIASAALDGAGSLWFTTSGSTVVVANGTSTITSIGGLHQMDKTGKLLTPFNASKGVYGLQTQEYLATGGGLYGLAVDANGNIWLIGSTTPTTIVTTAAGTTAATSFPNQLVKIPGLAVPKTYQ